MTELPGNQKQLVLRTPKIQRGLVAVVSGMVLSLAFAPAEWAFVAWVAIVPVLIVGLPQGRAAWRLGYLFGLGHFITTFAWLRDAFILGPLLLALVCALLPACWLKLAQLVCYNLRLTTDEDLKPQTDRQAVIKRRTIRGQYVLLTLFLALSWCAFEWVRSWFFSGFPWNQLGVSQWQNEWLLPVTRVTGVYGISFLILASNAALYFLAMSWCCGRASLGAWSGYWRGWDMKGPCWQPLVLVVVLVGIAGFVGHYEVPKRDSELRIATVQGNIPQIRTFTEAQLELAKGVYEEATLDLVSKEQPDLIIWPETALPATLRTYMRAPMDRLLQAIKTPLLAGTIDYRELIAPTLDELPPSFNSAMLYGRDGEVIDWYDKIHLVPFGEYVPFERYWPFLVKWIGMGRALTPGTEFTVMQFGADARLGVNICYEDVFPEISRGLVRRGANLLVVITNDAWFGESSGSRQHLAHSVMRAVETFRPLIRSGNNSDSCLILPTGEVRGLLYGTDTRFVRATRVYDVPIWRELPMTTYTRCGNWLGHVAAIVTGLAVLWCLYRCLNRRKRLYELVQRSD